MTVMMIPRWKTLKILRSEGRIYAPKAGIWIKTNNDLFNSLIANPTQLDVKERERETQDIN